MPEVIDAYRNSVPRTDTTEWSYIKLAIMNTIGKLRPTLTPKQREEISVAMGDAVYRKFKSMSMYDQAEVELDLEDGTLLVLLCRMRTEKEKYTYKSVLVYKLVYKLWREEVKS